MIRSPYLLFIALVGLVSAILWARPKKQFRWAFRILPVPFWCYFLPMAAATAGVFPLESPVYPFVSRYLLPFCLGLLLVSVNVRAVASLSRLSLGIMLISSVSIMMGGALSFWVFHRFLPPEAWKSVGALSGSWIGGSANMLALKEALSTPEDVFAPVVVVDTVLAYTWMAFLVFLAGSQESFDRWNKVSLETEYARSSAEESPRPDAFARAAVPFGAAAVSLTLALISIFLGDRLPAVGTVISHATWTVLLVTSFSLAFSVLGRVAAQSGEAEKWGTTILYILLASLGARVRLTSILEAPVFLALGFLWLVIHGAFLFAAGLWTRSPLFLLATASQACVGGPVSAPIVAAVYRPALAVVGLLMAILGNVLGTYMGFMTAQVCRWIAR